MEEENLDEFVEVVLFFILQGAYAEVPGYHFFAFGLGIFWPLRQLWRSARWCADTSLWARIALGYPLFWCSFSLPCASVCGYVSVGKDCAWLSVVLVLMFIAVCDLYVDHRCHCFCCGLVLFVGRHVLRESLRRDVVWWWFYCRWYLRFCMGQCEAGDWKFFLFPVPEVVGCVCMLNGWFSSNDEVCADFFIFFRFKLKDMLCSGSCICTAICLSRWTVIAWKCCPGGVPPLRFFTLGNGSHTIYVLCLPSERGMGMSMPWQFQSRVESITGRPCPRLDRKHH